MNDVRYRRLATGAAFASLFVFAAVNCAAPAALNEIGRFYQASNTALGGLFFSQAAAFCVATIAAGWLSDRSSRLAVLAAGCATMAAGAWLFSYTGSFPTAVAATIMMGAGGGFTEGTAMAAVSDLYDGSRRTSLMNAAQVFFALGAVAAPIAVSRMIAIGISWRWAYVGFAAACVVCALLDIAAAFAKGRAARVPHHTDRHWVSLATDPLVVALAVGIMLYVGAETGLGNWLARYFKLTLHSAEWLAALSVSFFWGGIGLGRGAAAWLSRHVSEPAMLCLALTCAAVMHAVVLLVPSPWLALGAVVLLGFVLGPVWPTILSVAGAAFPRQTGVVFGILVAMGTAGLAIFPPVIGWAADNVGIWTSLWICVVLSVINLGIFLKLRARLAKACVQVRKADEGIPAEPVL